MKCPQCAADNTEGKNFCSDCGVLLTPQLIPVIRNQVEDYIRENFKDQKLIELETTEAVATRVLKWAKIYYATPIAVLVIIFALLGISDYSDFHKTVQRATNDIKAEGDTATNDIKAQADTATKTAVEAQEKSKEAVKALNAAATAVGDRLASTQELANKLSGMESKTTTQIASASKHIEDRLTELDKKVEAANKIIAEQQSKLVSTNELVTAMFSKGQVETFQTDQGDTPTFAIVSLPKSTIVQKAAAQAVVYVLLKSAPIYQTLQLNWRVYVQPKSSYFVSGNLVTFFWGEPPENLKQWPLEVSYVPDPTYHGPIHKTMPEKRGNVVFDQETH
jgi:predicted RND superfamily exporter protein